MPGRCERSRRQARALDGSFGGAEERSDAARLEGGELAWPARSIWTVRGVIVSLAVGLAVGYLLFAAFVMFN
jgi:hypothetical protein